MYLLVSAYVTMIAMSCNAKPASVSKKHENVVTVATASNDTSLSEEIIPSVYETASHYTHTSSGNLDMNRNVNKTTLTDVNAISPHRSEECNSTCEPNSAIQSPTGSLKTQDGVTISSASLIYVSDTVEGDEDIDLDVKHEEKNNTIKILSRNNNTVKLTGMKITSSKTTVNFKNYFKVIGFQEQSTTEESNMNPSMKLSVEGSYKSRISAATSGNTQLARSNTESAEIKPGSAYRISSPSQQYLNGSQSLLYSNISNTANERVFSHHDKEHGLRLALKKLRAQDSATSYNRTAAKHGNAEHDLISHNSETVKLRGSLIRPAMLQHPNRTYVPTLEFPEVPEGRKFHMQELHLSEGLFAFSYISNFLSWILPYDFPVGKCTVEFGCKYGRTQLSIFLSFIIERQRIRIY